MDRLIVHPEPLINLDEPPLDPEMVQWVAEAAVLSDMCKEFRALPRAGGMLDQPAGLMRRMLWLRRYQNAVKTVEDPNIEEGNLPDSLRELVAAGVDTRLDQALKYTNALRQRAVGS